MDLKSIRRNRGYARITDAAKAAGITEASLSRIENGIHLPRPATARKLAKLYMLKPQEIWQLSYQAKTEREKHGVA